MCVCVCVVCLCEAPESQPGNIPDDITVKILTVLQYLKCK